MDKIVKVIMVIAFLVILSVVLQHCEEYDLEHDGFEIVEEYNTYCIAKKNGHLYMASRPGLYSNWTYEHYTNCPCKKTH